MNNFLGQYIQGDCFEKPQLSQYPFHQSLALLKHEVNKRGIIFENDDELMMMMMMMLMMMMMMNCFCGMVARRKAFNLISSRGHCQAGFEPAQNMSSGFDE